MSDRQTKSKTSDPANVRLHLDEDDAFVKQRKIKARIWKPLILVLLRAMSGYIALTPLMYHVTFLYNIVYIQALCIIHFFGNVILLNICCLLCYSNCRSFLCLWNIRTLKKLSWLDWSSHHNAFECKITTFIWCCTSLFRFRLWRNRRCKTTKPWGTRSYSWNLMKILGSDLTSMESRHQRFYLDGKNIDLNFFPFFSI